MPVEDYFLIAPDPRATASEELSKTATTTNLFLISEDYANKKDDALGRPRGQGANIRSLFSVGSVHASTASSSNALAVDVGGRLDVQLNRRFAIRAIHASYFRTQFPNTTTNVQKTSTQVS